MKKFGIRIQIIAIIFIYLFCCTGYAQGLLEDQLPELQKEAVTKLVTLQLLKGYPDGSLGIENPISRAEFCTVITRALGYEENPILSSSLPFTDVTKDYWGYPYIVTAYALKIVSGYPDNTFMVKNQITYAEAVTMLVRALGYNDEVKGDNWPANFLEVGNRMGIMAHLEMEPGRPVTRGEIALMINNSLSIKLK